MNIYGAGSYCCKKKDIHGKQNYFGLEENLHEAIFLHVKSKKEYPVLYIIEDYYSDAVILFGELLHLKEELQKISKAAANKKSELHALICFIEQAMKDKNNIYALAD